MKKQLENPEEDYDGHKHWYKINELGFRDRKHHREDGPAIEYWNGDCEWYLNGENYYFDEYIEKIKFKSKEDKILFYLKWK